MMLSLLSHYKRRRHMHLTNHAQTKYRIEQTKTQFTLSTDIEPKHASHSF